MAFQQPHPEAPCLRFPENIGIHPNVTIEAAVNMLVRAAHLSLTVPYSWTFIDKPADGQVFLIFLPNPAQFPNDGIRYQEQEIRYTLTAPGNREMEVMEIKYGFIPNTQETTAWRVRRRYRLIKGGHPQITLVHYARGPVIQTVPSLLNSPVRQYPLRQVTEPPMYVMGDKAGQKVYPASAGPPPPQGPIAMNPQAIAMNQPTMGMNQPAMGMNQPAMGMNQPAMGMNQQAMGMNQPAMGMNQPAMGMNQQVMGMNQPAMGMNQPAMGMSQPTMGMNQPGMGMPPRGMSPQAVGMNPQGIGMSPQAMLAQQNSNMESLERRRERERTRERSGSMGAQRPGPPRLDDDESADEFEMISTRTLAITRYKRNHELMEEVFKRAAFGALVTPPPPAPAYSIFDKAELESKVAKLQQEVELLQAQAAERTARRSAAEDVFVASGHTPMEVSS